MAPALAFPALLAGLEQCHLPASVSNPRQVCSDAALPLRTAKAGAQGALRVGALDVVASVCLNSGVLALVPRTSHFLAAVVALSERAAAAGDLDLIAMCAHRACGAACDLRVCNSRACALHLICCPSFVK